MKRLAECLTASDRDHLKKILNASLSVTPTGLQTRARVHRFLQSSTFLEVGTVPFFQRLSESKRERLLSELVWRITCFVDGSQTAVLGAARFDLGDGFVARETEREGKPCFCLTKA